MAPKKKPQDNLIGKTVLAPSTVWPNFPLPKGKQGWEGEPAAGGQPSGRMHG